MKLVYLTIFSKFQLGSRYFLKYLTNSKVINTYITNIGTNGFKVSIKIVGCLGAPRS